MLPGNDPLVHQRAYQLGLQRTLLGVEIFLDQANNF